MKTKFKYPTWTLIEWDGNPSLNLKCWRKSFRRGHVSVGAGDFTTVVFDYGANSDDSFSDTRWRPDNMPPYTEEEAMKGVDATGGRFLPDPRYPYISTPTGYLIANPLYRVS